MVLISDDGRKSTDPRISPKLCERKMLKKVMIMALSQNDDDGADHGDEDGV